MYPEFHPSPLCECGQGIADRVHFLFHCTKHSAPREKLFDQIDKGYHDTKTDTHLRSLNMERLIGPNNDLTPEMKLTIQRSIGSFLLSTLSTDIWAAFTTKTATCWKFPQAENLLEVYQKTISAHKRQLNWQLLLLPSLYILHTRAEGVGCWSRGWWLVCFSSVYIFHL
jgi:hypothetical protein